MRPFDEVAPDWMRKLMADLELAPHQAAGIMGNLGYESNGFRSLQEIAPAVPGSRGGAGVAMWTASRRRAFEAWAATEGLSPSSDAANYGFLMVELRGAYRRVAEKLRATADVDRAVFVFGHDFEAPGGTTATHLPGFAERLHYAQRALAGAGGAISTAAAPAVHQIVRRTRPLTRGPDVEEIQRRLGIEVDGVYGPQTEMAVRNFQVARGLVADGVVGEKSWTELSRISNDQVRDAN